MGKPTLEAGEPLPSNNQNFLIADGRTFNVQVSSIRFDSILIGLDVYSTVLFEYFILRDGI
jgi:hypothetical protein